MAGPCDARRFRAPRVTRPLNGSSATSERRPPHSRTGVAADLSNPRRRRSRENGRRLTMDKIRVVLVDDHEVVRYGLHGILDAEPDMVVVGEAASGEDALRVAREVEPDVLLLDVKLAGMDGPEVCRRVLDVSPRINVVMLTSYTQEAVILRSLAAGARGYIVKDIELGALKDAIRSVHRGSTVLFSKITRRPPGTTPLPSPPPYPPPGRGVP